MRKEIFPRPGEVMRSVVSTAILYRGCLLYGNLMVAVIFTNAGLTTKGFTFSREIGAPWSDCLIAVMAASMNAPCRLHLRQEPNWWS